MANIIDSWRGGGRGTGAYDLRAASPSQVPLSLRGASGQTANLFEIKDFAGTLKYYIDSNFDVYELGHHYITDVLTVTGDATVGGTLGVTGATTLSSLTTSGNATIGGVLNVTGNSTFSSAVTIQNNLTVNGGFTTTGVVMFPSGTAAAPSISFAGDPDTGFYSYSANAIGIATGGTSYGFISGGAIAIDIYRSLGANLVTLKGNTPDGATAVGAVIDNAVSLTTAGAKIVSFKNATVEKAYITKDGDYWGHYVYADQFASYTQTLSLTFKSLVNDGGGSVAHILDAYTALTLAGGKLISVRNATAEKAYIDYRGCITAGDGTLLLPAYAFMSDPNSGIAWSSSDNWSIVAGGERIVEVDVSGIYISSGKVLGSSNSVTFTTVSYQVDGATKIGTTINTSAAFATVGAKLLSIQNSSVEKAFIDCQGKLSLGDSSPLYLYPQERTPSVCVAGTPSAGGSVTDGTHSYKVTFVTAEGESTPSAKSNVITCGGGNNTVALTGIPLGGSRVTARKIYRTDAGDAGNWKLVATIANNTATTASDTAADAGGAAAPTVNTTTNLFVSAVADSATANGFVFNTAALSTAGANLLSIQNNGIEKFFVNLDGIPTAGALLANGAGTVAIANDSADVLEGNSGWQYSVDPATGTKYRYPVWAI